LAVASHSIFGFVESIISTLLSKLFILSNKLSKFKSQTKTQFIGEMAHHNI
jgi:hypothetical protein